jgi:hypothetical protein
MDLNIIIFFFLKKKILFQPIGVLEISFPLGLKW